jgi:type IV pilus assembly protein PilM
MAVAASYSNGTRRGPSLWRRIWNTPWPTLGCEIAPAGVSVARWSSGTASFESAAWKPIPPGAIEASPLRENIRESAPVREALGAALSSVGIDAAASRSLDAVLVIPDQAARLFAFSLDSLPKRPSEALSLVQFRLKKSVPFDIESAAVSYEARRRGDQWEIIAVAAPQPVIKQYEALLESCGLRPRCVVLSTLATLGLLPETRPHSTADPAGLPGVLVAKYSAPWFTTAILQGGQVRLFRTVSLAAAPDGLLSAEAVLEALYPSMVFFQDNFGGKLESAKFCGLGDVRRPIAELFGDGLRFESMPLTANGSLGAAVPDLVRRETYFSALLGVLEEHFIA